MVLARPTTPAYQEAAPAAGFQSFGNTHLPLRNPLLHQFPHWLLALPKPAAILASNDVPARHLVEMCRQLDLRVPFDVAVLGVDNDELECLLSHPPLSSVVNPAEQIGCMAATVLDRLMSGRKPPRKPIYIFSQNDTGNAQTVLAAVQRTRSNSMVQWRDDDNAKPAHCGTRPSCRGGRTAIRDAARLYSTRFEM